ncbi:MAG: glycosyltransferase family 39 protein, partial [Myxococcales bacterium]
MTVVLAAAAVAISGAAASSFAPVRGAFRGALAALFGVGIWSAGYTVALFAFGADPLVRLAKDALLVAAGTVVLVRRPRRAAAAATSRDSPRWPAYAVAAAAVLATAFFVEHTIRYPDGGWDAWAIWNLRARFLARGGAGFRAAFSPEILFWAHRDYPLLVPGAVAQSFLLARSESPWVPAAVSYTFAAAAVALLGAAARELRGAGWGALAALALVSTPCFVGFASNQQADVAVGALLLAACALTAIAIERGEPRALLPAGFAASLAAWTKNEGALYFACLGTALLATRWAPPRQRLRAVLRFALGGLPVLAQVAGFKLRVAHESDLFTGASASRIL